MPIGLVYSLSPRGLLLTTKPPIIGKTKRQAQKERSVTSEAREQKNKPLAPIDARGLLFIKD
ncbi:hypothetical protein HMPREF9134_01263 [Porphyromonas catoniae F0037]|uniref:Uncharacterized protein n=1 Tax=Porphyromonas catoniae F0037 TaxID=1127696 RepID=L1NCB3_9PORP|nr:hypothetical protein HMPREF9134_01263 [Porphyromonas catoniae F0037]